MTILFDEVSGDTPAVLAIERKGIGHPDTLSDVLADEFSRQYSSYCLDHTGTILNHWVDKLCLVGASAKVQWGQFHIYKPITVHLFGKITQSVGNIEIPIRDLLVAATQKVLPAALHCDTILKHVTYNVENTVGMQVDHSAGFYNPMSIEEAKVAIAKESVSNDTVICSAFARRRNFANLAIKLECLLTSSAEIMAGGISGTDVKIALLYFRDELQVTICVPAHADKVASRADYDREKERIYSFVVGYLQQEQNHYRYEKFSIFLNTKDGIDSAYITPFGTALGKGDCGVVGRGNRINGVIDGFGPSTCEAPSGKNPMHHAGKLYTIGAQLIADQLILEGAEHAKVLIATDNGRPLLNPRLISISSSKSSVDDDTVESIARRVLDFLASYWRIFPSIDTVKVARMGISAYLRQNNLLADIGVRREGRQFEKQAAHCHFDYI